MSVSFLIFLAVCIFSFVPVVRDHGKTWREFCNAKTKKDRRAEGFNVCVLWFIPVFTLIGTIVTGIESVDANRESKAHSDRILSLSNTLAKSEAKVQDLEAKQQRRTITQAQITNFTFLTERITKIPIVVRASKRGDDTESFAYQIRFLLSAAGFTAPTNSGTWGITRDSHNAAYLRPVGNTNNWPDVMILSGSNTDNPTTVLPSEFTNNVTRPIVMDDSPQKIHHALLFCLKKVNIKVQFDPKKTNWLAPGEYELLILQKNN